MERNVAAGVLAGMVYKSGSIFGLVARMLHRLWWPFLCLVFLSYPAALQCKFTRPASQRYVSYTFDPVFSGERMALLVTLEFTGDDSGQAELDVPSTYAGQQNLDGAFMELKAL